MAEGITAVMDTMFRFQTCKPWALGGIRAARMAVLMRRQKTHLLKYKLKLSWIIPVIENAQNFKASSFMLAFFCNFVYFTGMETGRLKNFLQ